MIKGIIKLGLLLVVGLIAYNLFLGDETEQAQSKEIINKVKDLGKSGVDLVKAEKDKFDAGKYDDAVDKVGKLFDQLKSKAQDSKEMLGKILYLDEKRDVFKDHIQQEKAEKNLSEEESAQLDKEFKDLMQEIKNITREMGVE